MSGKDAWQRAHSDHLLFIIIVVVIVIGIIIIIINYLHGSPSFIQAHTHNLRCMLSVLLIVF